MVGVGVIDVAARKAVPERSSRGFSVNVFGLMKNGP